MVVLPLLVEICAVHSIYVAAHLGAQVPVGERGGVDVGAVALEGVGEIVGKEALLKGVEELARIVHLLLLELVGLGVVNAHGNAVGGVETVGRQRTLGVVVPVVVGVEVARTVSLKEVAARDVGALGHGVVLLADVDAVGAHVDLIGNLIVAHILVVNRQIYELGCGVELKAYALAHGHRHGVADERLVAVVGQQHPLLSLGVAFAQELLLLMKFQFVRFLGQPPRGVAAAAHLERVVEGHAVVLIDVPHSGIDVVGLARDGAAVEGVDVDVRQVGQAADVLHRRVCRVGGIGYLLEAPRELRLERVVGIGEAVAVGVANDRPERVAAPRVGARSGVGGAHGKGLAALVPHLPLPVVAREVGIGVYVSVVVHELRLAAVAVGVGEVLVHLPARRAEEAVALDAAEHEAPRLGLICHKPAGIVEVILHRAVGRAIAEGKYAIGGVRSDGRISCRPLLVGDLLGY